MKIADFQAFVVANSALHQGDIYWLFVKLTSEPYCPAGCS